MTGVGGVRTAVVTGGGRGIGAATALSLGRQGWQVAVVDLDLAQAQDTATRIRDKDGAAVAIGADVAAPEDWTRAVATTRAQLGPVTTLVSNAAYNAIAPFEAIGLDSWRRHLDVNLTGAFLGVQACLPDLREHGGSVVVVSSVHAAFGLPLHAAYAAGKAGVEGLTRQLAAELAPQVRVNAVRPGPILTAAWDDVTEADRARSAAGTLLGRLGEPAEVADAVAFLAGPTASFITGTILTVDGGWSITKDSA